jgi:hypothetical protein
MSEQVDPHIVPMPDNKWGIVITIFPGNGSGDRQVVWEDDGGFNVDYARHAFYKALDALISDVHERTIQQQGPFELLEIEGDGNEQA